MNSFVFRMLHFLAETIRKLRKRWAMPVKLKDVVVHRGSCSNSIVYYRLCLDMSI